MKTWIKRSLIGLAAAATLFGGLAAYAHNRMHGGWHAMSEADAVQMKERIVERIGSKLTLDANQKAKLGVLADKLREQRNALVGTATDPRAEFQQLMAGNTFDRTQANALVKAKVAAVNSKSPEVVTAMGDFFDSLKPEQQAQVRAFMAQRGHRGHREHRGPGEHGG